MGPNADNLVVDGFGEAPLTYKKRNKFSIAVVGVGRSGTGFVGYVLKELFGVCMAHTYDTASDVHRYGAHEEHGLISHTQKVADGTMTAQQWNDRFNKIHENCEGLCGCKQTRFALLKTEHWKALAPKLIIRTWRLPYLVIDSLHKYRKGKRAAWVEFHRKRETNMRRALYNNDLDIPVVTLHFWKGERSPESVAETLYPYVQEVRRQIDAGE